MTKHWREGLLGIVGIASLALAFSQATALEGFSSHDFIDTRPLWGIPNFANIVSNIPLLIVGALGLSMGRAPSNAPWSWAVFFVGIAAAFFGSSFYHWAPDDTTLAWDRVPIAIGFMGLFVALLSEHLYKRERWLLIPALAVAAISVAWWAQTGNLSLYAWVQFFPLLAVLLLLVLFKSPYPDRGYLLIAFGFYGAAKLAELYDVAIFDLTGGTVSGHTLKHLLDATGVYFIYRMLKLRKPTC